MTGRTQLWLLLVVARLFVSNTKAYASYPSITLPDWRTNADYFTKCDFDNDMAPFCDWTAVGLTRSQAEPGKYSLSRDPVSQSGAAQLQSSFLYSPEDSCLEFWYYKPGQSSSELRVLLRDDLLQTQVWTSLTAESNIWKQVFIPLKSSRPTGVQTVLELSPGQEQEEEIVFDMVGIRRGQCGSQCQAGIQFWSDESTQCTCAGDQLTCTLITCGDGQTCRTLRPTDSFTSGKCRVADDLRYTTFDGFNFRFMGPCTYILTKACDGVRELPSFVVEVQKEQRSNLSVSSIQQVNVKLQGLRVTLLKRERRRIMINGVWRDLPLSLDGDRVKISAQGPVVELQTNFNLSVSFARSGIIQVTVPNQFSDKLCGMCGNFNHMMDDDSKMPDGSLAEDAQALGQSWKSEDPQCQEPVQPTMCSEAEKLEFASEAYCGILLSHHGPFSECSSALGAVSFFRSCVFEHCSTQGDPEAFCDVLQAFAKTCSEAGILVPGWRNATFCPLACGPNSHFNACSSDCPATCSRLDVPESCGSCEERCECDEGFLLSGGTCVTSEDCGCWVEGQHYEKGQTFMDGECERFCSCTGHGTVQCTATSCLSHEVCKVKNEVLGCFPSSPATCSVYGDPHYITFDGKAYSFRGTCNYTIATTCTASEAQFTVTARNEPQNYSTTLNSVALHVEDLHLVIRKNKLVYVNEVQITLPYSHSNSVNVSLTGSYVQVDTNLGLRLLFNGKDRLFVQADERHKGRMCGLCGTYSGSQFDDFLTPDGNVVPYPHDFARSWNTQDNAWMCYDGPSEELVCRPELENEGFRECSKLFGDAFKPCHWFVPPQIFVNSCVYDYCTTGGDLPQLCTSLQNYVATCEVAEVFLGTWWTDTVCANIPTIPPSTSLLPTPPPPQTTQAPIAPTTSAPSGASCPLSCNFDQNECGWEQLIQDSFDWTRWSGSTPTDFTGPSGDHITGSGFYMYIKANGVHHGDSARMMSPVCNSLGTQCLTFWYHMYGRATAMALNLYKLDGSHASKIWSKVNNQGDNWQLAQIEISSSGPFQIIVEGIRGSNVWSDVAWDDVTMTHGKCGDNGVNAKPELPSPSRGDMSFITSAPLQPGDLNNYHPVCRIDCNFDNNLCTWDQLLTDAFDWTRHSGSTTTPMTGPSSDHTTGSGHYIYIEGDSATHGDTARLLSEECTDQQPQCLQFWYHMYGSSWTMGLSVYLLHGNRAREVWRKREDQGNTWHRALVDLTPQENFKIIFEGRRGDNTRSDVAVDDISLHQGTCSDLMNQMTALPTTKADTTESSTVTTETTSTTLETTTTTPETTTTTPETTTTTLETTTTTPEITTATLETTTTSPETTTTTPETTTTTLQTTDLLTTTETMIECDTEGAPDQTTTPETTTTTLQTTDSLTTTETMIECDTEGAPDQTTTIESTITTLGTTTTTPESTTTTLETTTTTLETTTTTPETTDPLTTTETIIECDTEGAPDQTTTPETTTTTLETTTTTPETTTTTPETTTTTLQTTDPLTTTETITECDTEGVPDQTTTPETTTTTLETTTTTLQTTDPLTTTETIIECDTEGVPDQTTTPEITTTTLETTTTTPEITTTTPETTTTTLQTTDPLTTTETIIECDTEGAPDQTTTSETTTTTLQTTTTTLETTDPLTTTETITECDTEGALDQTTTPETTSTTPETTTTTPETTTTTTTITTRTPQQTPSCPTNSHYTDCVPKCLATCEQLHGLPNCNTDEPCVQGCVCDNGFVLKQHVCVPIWECGCQDDDGNNRYFGEKWYSAHCTQKCECKEKRGKGELKCKNKECDGDEVCLMSEQGEYSCKSADFSECSIDDDPEYRTFDNMKHKFKGKHSYILVQTFDLPKNIPEVYVVGINQKSREQDNGDEDHNDEDHDVEDHDGNERHGDSSEEHEDSSEEDDDDDGRVRALRMRVYNHTVEFREGRKVMVDGVQTNTPDTPVTGLRILERSSRLYLKTDFGFSVEFNGKGKAEITLPDVYKTNVGGLCGNFDGNKRNDMMKPDGEQAKNLKEFGESWRVTEDKHRVRQRRFAVLSTLLGLLQ